jgi:type VI secretion system protein ImpH
MPLDLNKVFLYEGTELNFFQAVYLLERLFEGRGRIGTSDDMRSEPIRFETLNTLAFPASELAAVLPPLSFRKQAEDLEAGVDKSGPTAETEKLPPLKELLDLGEGPLRIVVTFMGLYGVSSPLPSYFVDPITLKKVEYFELKKFLDIFTHRLYALFYRSWKKYRHYSLFEPSRPDDYTLRLLALTGQWPRRRGKAHIQGQSADFNLRRIPYARFLGNRVRSAKGLQQLLRGYFGFPWVKIREFESSWIEIPVKTHLGTSLVGLGRSSRIGDRMQDRMSRFTVEIGPMPRALFNRFMPSPERPRPKLSGSIDLDIDEPESESDAIVPLLTQVREIIDAYLRDPLDYQIKVILDPNAAQVPVLGSEHARMGMGIWLGARPTGEIACRL